MRSIVCYLSLGFSSVALIALGGCEADVSNVDGVDTATDPLAQSNIDMADYVIANCNAPAGGWQVGSEQFRVIPLGMNGNQGRFAIVKSVDGDGYEEWSVEQEWLRIRTDTTWAYEESPGGAWCDVKCGDNAAGTCQQRWNTNPNDPRNGLNPTSPWAYTVYQEPGNPSLGAKWIQRKLSLAAGGTTEFTTQMEIKAGERTTCVSCGVNFGTKPGQSVSRRVQARRYASWNGFTDVVHLTVLSGPGQGEQYFYGRGQGWIGFNERVASKKVTNTVLPISACAGLFEGSICAATGQKGTTPTPTPTGTTTVPPPTPVPQPTTPPPPPPPGGCECRADVDNYCLYPKSTANCSMTGPGGYCDPNGDGSFNDADWVRGFNEYHANCPNTSPPPPPPPPPPGTCACRTDVDNFCLYPVKTTNCSMTQPGGYCDPNGDGSFNDADWVRGFNEYHASCP